MHANLHLNSISRKQGKNAAAASAYRSGGSVVAYAAYRSGEVLEDKRYDKTHDYTQKGHVLHAEIVTPDHAPEWMRDRQSLWNGVEAGEKRKDAQLAKEAVITLPRNLDHEQHKEVVRNWVKDNITRRGLIADFAIHNPDASDGGKNPHAHVMFTLRPVQEDGTFGKKLTGYKDGGLDGKEVLWEMKFSYQDLINKASAANDNNQIVFDLRSYKDRGIDKIPQPKKSLAAINIEKKGGRHHWWRNEVERVRQVNQAKKGKNRYIGTFSKFGSGNKNRASLPEHARQQIADTYFDIMFGDGEVGSFEKQNNYER